MKMEQWAPFVVLTVCGLFIGGCYDAEGFDPQGYNVNGYDRSGLTREASPTTRALVQEGEQLRAMYNQVVYGTSAEKSAYTQRRASFLSRCNQQLEHIDRMGIAQMNQPSIYDKGVGG